MDRGKINNPLSQILQRSLQILHEPIAITTSYHGYMPTNYIWKPACQYNTMNQCDRGIKHGPTFGVAQTWMEHSQHTIIGEKLIFKIYINSLRYYNIL